MDQKQQEALKRKFEEAKEQNRRLQEAVETHRKNFIDNELILLYSALDLKKLLESLVNDQQVLFKCLWELKNIEDKTESTNDQINQMEEDLEQRRAQIIEMSSKEEDLDEKVRKISEHFTSVPELRTAVVHVLNKLLDTRDDLTSKLTKAEDRIEQLLEENFDLKVRINELENLKGSQIRKRISIFDSDDEDSVHDEGSSKSKDNFRDPEYFPGLSAIPINRKKPKLTCGCRANCANKNCVCKRAGIYCNDCNCTGCLNTDPWVKEKAENQETTLQF